MKIILYVPVFPDDNTPSAIIINYTHEFILFFQKDMKHFLQQPSETNQTNF